MPVKLSRPKIMHSLVNPPTVGKHNGRVPAIIPKFHHPSTPKDNDPLGPLFLGSVGGCSTMMHNVMDIPVM